MILWKGHAIVKTSSAKAKGRELCKIIKAIILQTFPTLEDTDIKVTSSGANGEDLQFSPEARKYLPISIEAKNHAKYAVYKDYAQAVANSNGYTPVLVIKQNRSTPLVVLDLTHFIELMTYYDKETKTTKET